MVQTDTTPRASGATASYYRHVMAGPDVVHGPGALACIGEEFDRLGCRRVLAVTSPSFAANPANQAALAEALGERLVEVFAEVAPHVPEESVEAATLRARAVAADGFVAIGGGAAIDTAKGAALLLAEGGEALDHQVVFTPPNTVAKPPLSQPKRPVIVVPLTLSGAEATAGISLNSTRHSKKINIFDPGVRPALVVQDPSLAVQVPVKPFVRSGMNALANCVEVQYARRGQPFSESHSLHAASLLRTWLPRAVQDPVDLEARARLLVASYLAVCEFQNTGGGVVHGICHAITGVLDVPHGDCYAALLPAGMEFNLTATTRQQAALATAFGVGGADEPTRARAAVTAVRRLRSDLGAPGRLRDLGVPREAFPRIAELTLTYYAVADNPVPITDTEPVTTILEAAW